MLVGKADSRNTNNIIFQTVIITIKKKIKLDKPIG